jgi:hypothetical protein
VDVYDDRKVRIGHLVTLASIARRRRTVRPRRVSGGRFALKTSVESRPGRHLCTPPGIRSQRSGLSERTRAHTQPTRSCRPGTSKRRLASWPAINYYRDQLLLRTQAAAEAPRELRELEARIARLRDRLGRGDSDMPPDELHAAIERAEGKRRELVDTLPEAKVSYKLLAKLPQAARLYRQQIIPSVRRRSPCSR